MKVIKWLKLSSDASYQVMKVIKWWKLSIDESYQVMKMIKWWKLSIDRSYQVMKVIKWRKLSSDESYQVVKVILWWKLKKLKSPKKWKGVMAGDVSPKAMFLSWAALLDMAIWGKNVAWPLSFSFNLWSDIMTWSQIES